MVAAAGRISADLRGNIRSMVDRATEDFYRVKALVETGLSDYKIAARTGVNRSTVQRWRHRRLPPLAGLRTDSAWEVPDPAVYCYLLGCYLGDGHVTYKPPGTWTLRISCDRKYDAIIDEIRAAMNVTFPGRRSTRIQSSTGASDIVSIHHSGVGRAFPQHGPGRKHRRRIALDCWQL